VVLALSPAPVRHAAVRKTSVQALAKAAAKASDLLFGELLSS